MAAYVIFIRESVHSPDEMAIYSSLVPPSLVGRTLKPLVRYGELEMLEGEGVEGVVVIEFPDADAAREWYHSPEYQKAVEHRKLGSRYKVLVVDGVS
jgi:uncharacterized protein (DUF1330 family)